MSGYHRIKLLDEFRESRGREGRVRRHRRDRHLTRFCRPALRFDFRRDYRRCRCQRLPTSRPQLATFVTVPRIVVSAWNPCRASRASISMLRSFVRRNRTQRRSFAFVTATPALIVVRPQLRPLMRPFRSPKSQTRFQIPRPPTRCCRRSCFKRIGSRRSWPHKKPTGLPSRARLPLSTLPSRIDFVASSAHRFIDEIAS